MDKSKTQRLQEIIEFSRKYPFRHGFYFDNVDSKQELIESLWRIVKTNLTVELSNGYNSVSQVPSFMEKVFITEVDFLELYGTLFTCKTPIGFTVEVLVANSKEILKKFMDKYKRFPQSKEMVKAASSIEMVQSCEECYGMHDIYIGVLPDGSRYLWCPHEGARTPFDPEKHIKSIG